METVIFIEHDGTRHEVDAKAGVSLMEAARMNNVPGILADCGGACACATCHVMVPSESAADLVDISDEEEAMLEFGLEERTENSRLSCQLTVSEELDGIELQLPESQV
ncbi:MAG: 2Fe-2S iron-sulfur cluster-binding protein [Pseudomonadota bacterium]